MKIRAAERITNLSPYLFAELKQKKREAKEKGVDLIELGEGDPDLPTPEHIVARLCEAVRDPQNHRYPTYEGMLEFRSAVAQWYKERFNVSLDPGEEVLTLMGAKDGCSHVFWALVDPADLILLPNPAYPVYKAQTLFSGGFPYNLPLFPQNDFLPNLDEIPEEIASRAKLLFLNYPNNPTGATAPKEFYQKVVEFAQKYGIVILNDAVYSEVYFDNNRTFSLLEVEGAKEVGVEFHSLSKTYNMTGWRIGFAVGNKEILQSLLKVKTNSDTGVFQAIQIAGIEALTGPQNCVEEIRQIYQERRDILLEAIQKAGWEVYKPKGTFYLWVKVPLGYSSLSFTEALLERAGLFVTPGVGLGEYGEGYIRLALTTSTERIKEAARRIESLNLE